MRSLFQKRYAGIFEFLLPPFLFCETYANRAATLLWVVVLLCFSRRINEPSVIKTHSVDFLFFFQF